jgi:hypothetical protein
LIKIINCEKTHTSEDLDPKPYALDFPWTRVFCVFAIFRISANLLWRTQLIELSVK